MKQFILISLVFLAACGEKAPKDPLIELNQLKDQRISLDAKIAELEKKINISNPGVLPKKIRNVTVMAVQPELFRHYIDLQGAVNAEDSQPITSRMPGTLKNVYIKNGDFVKKGQLVAELENDVMERSMSELQNQITFATDLYNRQKSLWDQKIGTEFQYLQAKNQKEALEKSLATMQQQMSLSKIYSPVTGTADMVISKTGDAAAPGMPIAMVVNLSKLKVKGEVPESYGGKVKQGDNVTLLFPDLNKETTSKVVYMSKSINPVNRTFTIECALPSGNEYKANMIAIMKIIDYQNAAAISLPVNLVRQTTEGTSVFVVEKSGENAGRVVLKPVVTGSTYNGKIEIKSGIAKGDVLLTSNLDEINSEEKITF